MDKKAFAFALTGLGAVLCLVCLFAPWWTVSGTYTSGFGVDKTTKSARPFSDGGDIIEGSAALIAGGLVLAGALAIGTSAVFSGLAFQAKRPANVLTPWLGLAGSLALLSAVVLAYTTWPPDGFAFWDSSNSGVGGIRASETYAAGLGWYLAVIAVLVCAAGGIYGLLQSRASETRPAAP